MPRIWDEKARDPKTFENVAGLADGTVREPRWVVTDRGVMLTSLQCSSCHATLGADRKMRFGTPPGRPAGAPPGAGPPGLEFLTKLSPDDKTALIAFLRSL